MAKHQFSRQDVIRLLTQLKGVHVKYPPDLLAARRRLYLMLVAQTAATHLANTSRRQEVLAFVLREPSTIVIKVLIVFFVAFLIAFLAYSIGSGNIDFGWLLELMSN